MDVQYYIGIDVSKATLDWAVFNGKTIVLQTQSLNSVAAIKATIKALKALPGFITIQSVFCLEHTGVYNAHILDQLVAHQLPTWLESSLHIKQAGGLQRGKSDSLDAQRIAEYAYRFRDRMRLWQPPRQLLQELVILSALRQRLLLVRQQLQVPVNEQAAFASAKLQKQLTRHCQASLKSINADLEQVNRQMDELIHQDQQLHELFKLMTSILELAQLLQPKSFWLPTNLRTSRSLKSWLVMPVWLPLSTARVVAFAGAVESINMLVNA
ncbi:transposase [Spirosoma lacussanchae]